jgi:hypothetical protein
MPCTNEIIWEHSSIYSVSALLKNPILIYLKICRKFFYIMKAPSSKLFNFIG